MNSLVPADDLNTDGSTPSESAERSAPFYRGMLDLSQRCKNGLAFAMTMLLMLAPKSAFAGTEFALDSELQQFIDLISGPFGITVGTLAIIGCIFGMVFKSQRGEPYGKLGSAILGIFLILNIDSVMTFFFSAEGAAL